MNSKQTSIRVAGQRLIPSAFLSRSSNRSSGSNKDVEIKAPSEKKPPNISLSDFLNKKLHKSSVLPASVQRKEKQFMPPEGSKGVIQSSKENKNNSEKDAGEHCALDVMFEKLKQSDKRGEQGARVSDCAEAVISCTESMERSNKRRNTFEGDNYEQSAGKVLVVLGEDSKSQKKRNGRRHATAEKSTNYFNHYANGGGWWDSEKEGVDNEEVGCNGTWEVYHIPH